MIATSVFTDTLKSYNDQYRIIANVGGTRSGKTFAALQIIYLIAKYSKKKKL